MRNHTQTTDMPVWALALVRYFAWTCVSLLMATPVRYRQDGLAIVMATLALAGFIALLVQETQHSSANAVRQLLPDLILMIFLLDLDRVFALFLPLPIASAGATVASALVTASIWFATPSQTTVRQLFRGPLARAAVASIAGTLAAFALWEFFASIEAAS